MKILKTLCLKGPNYWSNFRKQLIVLTLDLEEYEYLPSNELPNFSDALKALLPSLYEHRCSPGVKGGFFMRLEEGTWLGHVLEHVALELQWLAGMQCGFGRTEGTGQEGIYHVVFCYIYEEAGLFAAHTALKILKTLAKGEKYLHLNEDIEFLKDIATKEQFGPSTQSLVDEAKERNIPVYRFGSSLVHLGYGVKQKKIWASVSSNTNTIAVDMVADKELTKKLLSSNFIPVPQGKTVSNLAELEEAASIIGYPLVTKPKKGNHGRGITTAIGHTKKLYEGFGLAQKISEEVLVERFIPGHDHRILVVNYKFVAAAKRTPAFVEGNGENTIGELIEHLNLDPRRGLSHENYLTTITVDASTLNRLSEQNFSLDTILPFGEKFYLKNTANLSSGGKAQDVTNEVHPNNIRLAERIAMLVGLDICGIDLIIDDIRRPLEKTNGAILEVNASPGLRMHLSPDEGLARNVAKPIIDMLFPQSDTGRIPIIGVTGTNGKTTVVTLLAKLAQKAGYCVGYTTTEGIYINSHLVYKGDCSGPMSAHAVLHDPQVNFAVLECARGGILRAGLGFDECDISIITNITGDHLGLKGIHTLEQLARVKGVLAHSTKKSGYAILNSEDEQVYLLRDKLDCQIALFGTTKNERIIEHCEKNAGLAIYLKEDMLTIQWDHWIQPLISVKQIPLTFFARARLMIMNIMPVILAAYISKISSDKIKDFLLQLKPTPDVLPGRMNLFHFDHYQVMLDYAHNEGAYQELKHFLASIQCDKRIGIIGVAGDRRDEDIINVGHLAAQLFDEIIIRHDEDGRGRTHEQITALLVKGINSFKNTKIKIISDEIEALAYAIEQAQQNAFIFYSAEKVSRAIHFLKELQQKNTFITQGEM